MERRIQIQVKGRVQGVFFRDYTRRKAQSLSLKGFVKNIRTGDVEINAQGKASDVDALLQWCWEGSPMSTVESVNVKELPIDTSLSAFSISY